MSMTTDERKRPPHDARHDARGRTELAFPRQPWGALIRIGYTGSRDGMSAPQMQAVFTHVARLLVVHDPASPLIEAHHGDCTGGDCPNSTSSPPCSAAGRSRTPLVQPRQAGLVQSR